ncbi:unnamed protein product [Brassica rapa]|uniref:Rab-GAP TBC domain-containing protein n=1 Tax=Brassica campestris TaxID=3711 RepID=A0A8D9MG91_BRACM|nr:unnamed protein product [Brassica rapa]
MVRKKVPEWLNSTMWSAHPPPSSFNDDDGLLLHSPATKMKEEEESESISFASRLNFALPVPSPSPRQRNNGSNIISGVVPSGEDFSRQAHLSAELSKKVINMKELRSLALQSLPDSPGIRSTVWKLLLGYLPPERSLWSSELKQKRYQYKHYKDELLTSPSEITWRLVRSKGFDNYELKTGSRCMLSRSRITDEDHPLSLRKASIWNTYFQDTETIEQIDKDVKRTHPDIPFFSAGSSFARSNQESMKNILLVFAKLNQGIRYVQGMNEILAPIFYILRNDPDEDSSTSTVKQLDNSVVGIRSAITRLSQLVRKHDEELWRHLEITTKVNPQFYAFRWITLLLTQEFSFFDSLHIWDPLLSDPEGPLESLLGICCAMLVLVRKRLIAGDFTSNMKLLQHYPTTNISHLFVIDVTNYGHSPVHRAVVTRDYAALKKLLSSLPKMRDPSEVKTEAASVSEETKADSIASVIDRRDVINRDTALHLAVKLGDETSAEMLMVAGADWSLQNEQGWSALQEAICGREERIAMIIVKHYQPLAWAKWCRRLPRLVATMHRMRDFYMEITFHFESSVIPFISRVAPSDTYKIWKRGANLRADMTLAGFDGFRIQRSDQTILFLGDGSEDGKVPSGSLLMISHKDKEIMNALDGAGSPASEDEVRGEVAAMSKTSIFRPGIDVTQAVLFPQLTWRRQERSEMVGEWKAKVYDMHNVVVSIKSRRVPGAMSDEELFSNNNNQENETESEDLGDVLTEDEKRQLELALKVDSPEGGSCNTPHVDRDIPIMDGNGYCNKQEKKGWFGGWRKRDEGHSKRSSVPPRSSLCVDEKKVSDLLEDDGRRQVKPGRHSTADTLTRDSSSKASTSEGSGSSTSKRKEGSSSSSSRENEYKKGLRPVLWLSERFPLQTKELLPLLDILANKVKAIRRLRELMTTKLPSGTFPVKVAIPVIPTIRVLVTFTKFEELEAIEDEFVTPPSSPTSSNVRNSPREETQFSSSSSSSWFQWIKTPSQRPSASFSSGGVSIGKAENDQDPFAIPRGYNWITSEEKKKKIQEKNKAKKSKSAQNS